jgi:hypothetical protein
MSEERGDSMTYDVKEKIAKLEMKMYELTSEATTLEQEYNQFEDDGEVRIAGLARLGVGRQGRHLHPRARVESQVQGLRRGVVVPIW